MNNPVLLWFKRDLRIQDHPALAHAAARGPVLPVFVIEQDYWDLPDTSGRQWAFVSEALSGLRADLAPLGAPLIVRRGDVIEVFEALQRQTGFARIVSHEETGNRWTFDRDLRVGAWARDKGIAWDELPQSGVVRRLKSRDGWAQKRNRFIAGQPMAPPRALPPINIDPGNIVGPDVIADPCPGRQPGGRAHGMGLLGSFLTERGEAYQRAMSSPVAGEWACSRLSPHLAFGTISVREAAHAGVGRQSELPKGQTAWAKSLRSFQSRLAWRDHFMQKLEDEPRIEEACLHRAYEGMRPKESDPSRLSAWDNGETGLPFVDACMRYTRATGWLNFRMRSMVTAVAAYHLWLDWRSFGPILARYFTDYEPGIHWSQLQMQSGTTGINTVRIYNPIKQGLDQDPTGAFTRQWCPELTDVPDAYLQEPWKWPDAGRVLGKTYPDPIVDVASAARAARETVHAIRKSTQFRKDANQIVTKHASRKEDRQFRRDPMPKVRRKDDTQLSFDL